MALAEINSNIDFSNSEITAEQCREAIIKLFSTENVSPNQTILNILRSDVGCSVFINFISRQTSHSNQTSKQQSNRLGMNGLHNSSSYDRERIALRVRDPDIDNELRWSYQATMLLTNDEMDGETVISKVRDRSSFIIRRIFLIFQLNASGNLRHGCRVIDHLMRNYLDDVYDIIGADYHTVEKYMGSMLDYIEHAAVAEVFLTLVCKPHNPATLRLYTASPSKKWAFFRSLSEWKLLQVLCTHVCGYQYSTAHTLGAADVFIELIDRLAADENGELLLQPAAHCYDILEGLIRTAVESNGKDTKVESKPSKEQRTAAMKCVFCLLKKSTMERVPGPPTSPYQSFGATIVNLVPNQLAPLREKIYDLTETHLPKLLKYLVDRYHLQQNALSVSGAESGDELPRTAVRHTAYVVNAPFTEFRLILVDTLVEIVSHRSSLLQEYFDAGVWRVLIAWFFEYSHTNLYHAAFYQLFFLVLRTESNLEVLKILLKKLKFVTLLIREYKNDSWPRTSNKGYILQVCNAIRLQAASQPPDAFLRDFLRSHTTWREFQEELCTKTRVMSDQGLGFHVPQMVQPTGYYDASSYYAALAEKNSVPQSHITSQNIDHGSEFARSLGFVDDVAWPDADHADQLVSTSKRKKKKKDKKKVDVENGKSAEECGGDNGSSKSFGMEMLGVTDIDESELKTGYEKKKQKKNKNKHKHKNK